MDRREAEALDRHITGNYGEDQFRQKELTPARAKAIIKRELETRGLPFTKLTAKTVSFADLARAECIFVKIHGWQASPAWDELRRVAVANGFRIET